MHLDDGEESLILGFRVQCRKAFKIEQSANEDKLQVGDFALRLGARTTGI